MGAQDQFHWVPNYDCVPFYALSLVVVHVAECPNRVFVGEQVGPCELLISAGASGIVILDLDRKSQLDQHPAG